MNSRILKVDDFCCVQRRERRNEKRRRENILLAVQREDKKSAHKIKNNISSNIWTLFFTGRHVYVLEVRGLCVCVAFSSSFKSLTYNNNQISHKNEFKVYI